MGRNRRRYGGYAVHLGIVLLALGVIGSKGYQQQAEAYLAPNQSMQAGAFTLKFEGLQQFMAPDDRQVTQATLGLYRGSQRLSTLTPHKDYFTASQQTSTIAGVRSTLSEDVYVLLAGWEGDNATFKVYVNPLVNWVWLGGILLTLGTLFAAWPAGSTQRRWSMVLSPAPSAAVEG